MAVVPPHVMFEGEKLDMFTYNQLEKLNSAALKQRGITIRDAVGKERLPTMPRHTEGLIKWMLEVQMAMVNAEGMQLTLADFGMPKDMMAPQSGGPGQPGSRGGAGPGRGGRDSEVGSQMGDSESNAAYNDARSAREAAKARNQGQQGGIF